MNEVLSDGVGGALIPGHAFRGLLRRHDLDETGRELIEAIALLDVAVQRTRVELSEDEDPSNVGVDAVADGNVHQAILAAQRDRRLGPILGQREKPPARATT